MGRSTTVLADGRVLFAGDQGMVTAMGAKLSPKEAAANELHRRSAELYVP